MSPSPSATDATNPSSPTTSLPTSSLFLPPPGPAIPLPPPSPSSSTTTSSPDPSSPPAESADAEPSWSSGYAENATNDQQPDDSDTPSTPGDKQNPVTASSLRATFRHGVRTATNVLATIAANPTEQEYGLWRADDDDLDGIARPASRLIYRRLPDEARNSDAIDLFGLALAIGAYVAKNLRIRSVLKEMEAGSEQITPNPPAVNAP
jgi:hypothetical protein